jgi:hypothetical protein
MQKGMSAFPPRATWIAFSGMSAGPKADIAPLHNDWLDWECCKPKQISGSAIKDKLVLRQKFYIQFTFGAARSVVQAFHGQPAAAEPSQCGSWWSTF